MKNAIFALTAIVLGSAVVLSNPTSAHADQVGPNYRPWVSALKQASRAGQLNFIAVDMTGGNVGGPTISPSTLQVLHRVAFEQAQIWGDTILEGDYLAANEILLDGVELVQVGTQILGYRITYSAAAVETTACAPSESYAQALENRCARGRILESSFVSLDLTSWTRDETRYASFELE